MWYQIIGLFKWNTTPETKSQKVDQKQNIWWFENQRFSICRHIVLDQPFEVGFAELFSTNEQL
jgi:hypothetical protein